MYNNNNDNTSTMKDIREVYKQAAENIYKVTKHKGIAVVKCMDSIESGKQKRLHIWIWQDFLELGFRDEDLFVLTTNGTPMIRWKQQKHARKNNSFTWVFRVWKKSWSYFMI